MDAAIELWRERWYDDITLQEIADRAAVSLSTVMRRFGSKEGVVDAILASDRLGTWGRRRRIATGDIGAAVRELVGDFVLNGDGVIRDLALEQQLPAIRHAVGIGRKLHREWVGAGVRRYIGSTKGPRLHVPTRPIRGRHRRVQLETVPPRPRPEQGGNGARHA